MRALFELDKFILYYVHLIFKYDNNCYAAGTKYFSVLYSYDVKIIRLNLFKHTLSLRLKICKSFKKHLN